MSGRRSVAPTFAGLPLSGQQSLVHGAAGSTVGSGVGTGGATGAGRAAPGGSGGAGARGGGGADGVGGGRAGAKREGAGKAAAPPGPHPRAGSSMPLART